MTEILVTNGLFHLRNDRVSYALRVVNDAYLMHVYFGHHVNEIRTDVYARFADVPADAFDCQEMRPDGLPQEYPTFGYGDLRQGAAHVLAEDGSRVTELRYCGYRIVEGKPPLEGMPATFDVENACKTLVLMLRDDVLELECDLSYTIFEDCDVVARHASFRNQGGQTLLLERAMSACVDFHDDDYQMLTLSGAWSRERRMDWRPLQQGIQGVSSARGASGLQQSPFFALARPHTTEEHGDVYGFALVYSGNFHADVTVDQYRQSRALIGLNDFDFSWRLEPGESFHTPEALLVYAPDGLGGMSRSFHTVCARHLTRGRFAASERPILINNWEATYFDFDEEKIVTIARKAAELGVEMFVLDDGWFGHRDADNCSLGDWTEDRRKLPDGLESLSSRIHALGMKFGLWFEPEMVSPDSDLYRAHPDWCLHVEGRGRPEQRHQLVLDLSRADVCEHVYQSVADVLARVPIDYVKWDMNRNFAAIGSALLPPQRQKETPHRYMLGLYGVLERLVTRFDHVLFESCASGGGRFDLGMLYYMPQTWCSDNTDAATRCFVQYGTSLVFPPFAMGAHISAVPNHQTGRVTSLKTRSDVAMGGTYGFELDVTKLTDEEQAEMKRLLARVKSVRNTLLYGTFYRLRSPYEGNLTAWMVVSADQREAVVTCVRMRAESNVKPTTLTLRGLQADTLYHVEETNELLGGDELMQLGLTMRFQPNDYASLSWILRAE